MGNIIISKYRFPKKIMRLCAIGMVANGKVDDEEKKCITNIVVRDIINNCKEFKKLKGEFEKLKHELTPLYKRDCWKETNTKETNTKDYKYSGDDIKFDISINTESDEYTWVVKKYLQKKHGFKNINDETIDKIINKAKKAKHAKNIVENINKYYVWARYYVERIVNRLETSNEQQGLFVDIGSYKIDDVKQELFDIILVILADNSILESERVAFMAIARVFRVRKVAAIWDDLANVGEKNQLFSGTFCIRIQRKEIIDADDVLMIQEAICNYKIKGALKEGLKNATIAEKERYVKTTDRRNNQIFKWAVWGFILSAAFIYINISFLVEDKTIIRECLGGESPIENIYYNSTISAISKNDIDINGLDSLFCSDPKLIQALARQNVKKCAEYDKIAIKEAKKEITRWMLKKSSHIGDRKIFYELFTCLIIWLLWILFPFIRWMNLRMKEKIFRNREFIHSMFLCVLCGIVFLLLHKNRNEILLSILHNPIWVLILMICIELMIFLRQVNVEKLEDEKKKNSTGLLVVIVVMAIVSDMCISFIELPVELKDGMLADKFAAALLLGCLCFFIGRFLNMYSLQERINISNMEASIKRIVKELKSSPEK